MRTTRRYLIGVVLAVSLAAAVLPAAAAPPATSAAPQAAATQAQGTVPLTPETFADPPASVRPGTRWWWDDLAGSYDFDLEDALEEVDAFAEAGFGRFEIAWEGGTSQFGGEPLPQGNYGTASQQAQLEAVAERAAEHGMQLDMTLGAGWPWAAPTTTGELGQQELMYGRTDVTGPTRFEGRAPAAIDDDEPRGTLEAVTAARVLERGPAVTEAGSPPASSTVLDPASLIDLTDQTDPDGTVTWDVPEGDWILFAFWRRHREGNKVSLIDEASVRAGLDYVSENQLGPAEPAVREVGHSFFEDSLELNAEELYWTPDMFEEFSTRRGYDMTRFLPLMFVQGVSDYWVPENEPVPDFEFPDGEGARYRHDYYETITDLYIDDHMAVVGDWAEQYGMQFRTQAAFGNNFEVIRSTREATENGVLVDGESLNAGDTPFLVGGEGTLPDAAYDEPDDPLWRFALDHYRQVTSGSHQGGSLEITSELGAWFGYELHTYLRQYKRMMDKEWAMGLTRPLLHGVTHSPADQPWPGASHFLGLVGEAINHRTWPEWQLLRPLSDYWARGALVLQQGKPRTDVAVLRDSFVTTAAGPTEPPAYFFEGQALEEAGFTIGYVDPVGLSDYASGPEGSLFHEGPSYDTLVIDTELFYVDTGRIPGDAAEAILAAAEKGLRVVFVGDLPQRGLGGLDPAAEDARVQQAVEAALALPTTRHVDSQADVLGALQGLGMHPAAKWDTPVPVYTQRRESPEATTYLLWNATGERQAFTGSFTADGAPTELDLWEGTFEPLAEYRRDGGRVDVPLSLDPHEVLVLHFPHDDRRGHVVETTADRVVAVDGSTAELRDAEGGPQQVVLSDGSTAEVALPAMTDAPLEVDGPATWTLQVDTYGPEGVVSRPAIPLAQLQDWRQIPGLQSESGIGTYTAIVTLPDGWAADDRATALDLGAFEGSVQVTVNGQLATRNIDPTAAVDVTDLLQQGDNAIEVVLATTPFNKAVASTATTTATRPLWPTSVAEGTQTYGLLGPVQLVPSARGTVALPDAGPGSPDGGPGTVPPPGTGPGQVPPGDSAPQITRHGGEHRVGTAVEVAQVSGRSSDVAVIATAAAYPDALAGVPLATHLDAPLLLSDPGGLSALTAEELRRRGTREVVLLGGEAALAPQVAADVEALGIAVRRIGGNDRFETAGLIVDELPATGRVALVEGGSADPARGWPDALSAGVLGDPILLATTTELPQATAARLSADIDVRIVGGPAAVGESVAAAVDDVAGEVSRLAGSDRYATSIAAAEAAVADGADPSTVWLATGRNWPDGLVAGAADGLVLLVDGTDPNGSPAVLEWLAGQPVDTIRLAGGQAAITAEVGQTIEARVTR